jgi:hypothetical protein
MIGVRDQHKTMAVQCGMEPAAPNAQKSGTSTQLGFALQLAINATLGTNSQEIASLATEGIFSELELVWSIQIQLTVAMTRFVPAGQETAALPVPKEPI